MVLDDNCADMFLFNVTMVTILYYFHVNLLCTVLFVCVHVGERHLRISALPVMYFDTCMF